MRSGEERLQQAEATLRLLVENVPDLVVRFDPDLRALVVGPAIERLTGRPWIEPAEGEAQSPTLADLGMPKALIAPWEAALRRVFASQLPECLELSYPIPASTSVARVRGTRCVECLLVPEPAVAGVVPAVLCFARDLTERVLAAAAEKRTQELALALREATLVLTRSLDRETVLVTLLERLQPMVPFDRASVMWVDEERVSVRVVFDGEKTELLPAGRRPEFKAADHPMVQGILRTGAAIRVPDIRAEPGWSPPAEPLVDASWLGVPLFARGSVTGVFLLAKREPGYFNDEHVQVAEALATQASVAVENAVLFAQMIAAAGRMRSLSRRLIEVQESERRNIARELHDEAGQSLASLRYGLRLLEREVASGADITSRVAELMQTTDSVIDGLHRLAADLRPASLDHLGLEAGVRQYVNAAGAKFGLTVRFKALGFTGPRLPMVVETAIYRVVQEAMTNIVRHAQATRVDVLLERRLDPDRGDRVKVVIEDDGVGFVPDRVERSEHLGLLGMRERAEALDGTLTVESAAAAGTTVVVEVAGADPNPDR